MLSQTSQAQGMAKNQGKSPQKSSEAGIKMYKCIYINVDNG